MNLSETVDTIVRLRQEGPSADSRVAEYLVSTLASSGTQVQAETFTFSTQIRVWVGVTASLLTFLFVVSLLKRWHRAAFLTALAVPFILVLELSFDMHVASWPVLRSADNIVAHFPVQDAVRMVIVGTHYGEGKTTPSGRFEETVSAFLLPMTLVITLLGFWQLMVYFRKLDFEDAHTIMLIMGTVCVVYYVLWVGVSWNAAFLQVQKPDTDYNAGSVALLTGLAEDMSRKYPRLENTWVTVAFFGGIGPDSHGARSFAKKLTRERNRVLPVYFIGCEEIGRGGGHAYVIPGEELPHPLYGDRTLIRSLNKAAVAVTGDQLEMVPSTIADSRGFIEHGYSAITITTLPEGTEQTGTGGSASHEIDRGQLLLTLQMIERGLLEFEKPPQFP